MTTWPWPAPAPDGLADHLVEGTPFADVPLVATLDAPVSLSRVPGRAVVAIYPWTGGPGFENPPGWDDIPGAHGSTPELEGFARLSRGFADVRVKVFGLSGQDPAAQKMSAERLDLPFPLLSDSDGRLAATMRLPTFVAGGTTFLKRLTLVLRDGVIERTYYPVHPPDTHAREVMYLCGATRPGAHLGR